MPNPRFLLALLALTLAALFAPQSVSAKTHLSPENRVRAFSVETTQSALGKADLTTDRIYEKLASLRRLASGSPLAAKGGGKLCFAAGTPIAVEDGSTQAIDELEVGDEVWAKDEVTGQVSLKRVTRTFDRFADDVLDIDFVSADGDEFELIATSEHPLWTDAGFAEAGSLAPGDEVWGQDGWAEVFAISSAPSQIVYNVEVEHFHTYFVGEEGLWAHNVCKVQPHPKAQGPHTGFKRDPTSGRVNGYTEFDSAGNAVKRFRGSGRPHGGKEPPLILDPRRGGGRPRVPRTPRPDELPTGY